MWPAAGRTCSARLENEDHNSHEHPTQHGHMAMGVEKGFEADERDLNDEHGSEQATDDRCDEQIAERHEVPALQVEVTGSLHRSARVRTTIILRADDRQDTDN